MTRGSRRSAPRDRRAGSLREALARGPVVVLDGAGGTALADRGVDIASRYWSAAALESDFDEVVRLHAAYAAAGARVHTTVTFRTHPGLFEGRGGEEKWRRTLRLGVEAARGGLERAGVDWDDAWVAGSMAPVGDSYRPDAVPGDPVLVREHGAQARGLVQAGVDLLLVETMGTVREARVAAGQAVETGLPVWVSFVVGPEALLLSGEPLSGGVGAVAALGVDAVLVNCTSLENTATAVPVLACSPLPWGVYPNGSTGDPLGGWGKRVPPDRFAQAAGDWIEAGARIVGSCCATGPEHTRALARVAAGAAGPMRPGNTEDPVPRH